ncbi:ATP-binding protein [Kitasatospora sp. NPDC006697]|uniref:ATP-binding protein n=1 Tax=Kitasatospora sp. NPDC006697 TaxID=3364020 RepID=UPI00369C4F03
MLAVASDPAMIESGFYLQARRSGFSAHVSADQRNLRRLRALARRMLEDAGVGECTVEDALLVLTELVANAVRACGDFAPLVVEAELTPCGIEITCHDPDPHHRPCRPGTAPDDPEAESGRGLFLLDALAPGWSVVRTPTGKQVRCCLPHAVPFPPLPHREVESRW